MTDRLTQLQDCLDQLTSQMLISLHYISTKHPWPRVPGMPIPSGAEANFFPDPSDIYYNASIHDRSPATADPRPASGADTPAAAAVNSHNADQQAAANNADAEEKPPALARPNSPSTFNADLHELAVDLVQKQKQIELLIQSLPGIGTTQEQQETRIMQLEEALRLQDQELREAAALKQELIRKVEDAIVSVRRV